MKEFWMKKLAPLCTVWLLCGLTGCAAPSVLTGVQVFPGADSETRETVRAVLETAATEALICVHVCGCVQAPGIYYLPEESRLMDAVSAAGGLTPEADSEGCNLAEKCSDGEQIRIPSAAEAEEGRAGAARQEAEKVNLNTAGREELMTLSGIGEVRAGEIIRYRESKGPFRSVEDLMQVSGIGKAAFEKIRERIKV